METKSLITLLRYAAVCGNILFVLWILFNAMDEGFRGTMPEKLSAIGLIGLLSVNSLLLLRKVSQKTVNN